MKEIYNEYSKIVYNYLISLTSNIDIANELTQETFYKAIKNINQFRNECSVKTWLCKIAKNEWIDYYKKTKKIKEINIDEIKEGLLIENSVEETYETKEQMISMYKRIHKLDEEAKEVIYLRIQAELSFKEIGQIMGRTEQWARIIFYRAKVKLKEELENE